MASGLYEILRVDKEATLEQIKKAYRKQALQTHPDRLPQNATEEDRDRATEEFRKVNNAYEVLSDPSKREIYDRHGVWPAPEAIPGASPGPMPNGFHSHGFPDSFASQAHPHSHRHHVDPFFTDPFRLFELFFGSGSPFAHDLHGFATPMRDPFFNSSRAHPYDPLSAMGMLSGPAFTFGGNLFDNQAFGNFPGNTSSRVYSSSSRSTRTPGQNWVEESESISSCNGVTTSVKRRVDANGNTYETRTDASGVRRFTINGIDHDGSHPAFDNTSSRFNAVRSSSSRVPPQIPAPSAAPVVPDPSTRPEGHHRASRRSHSRRDSYQAAAPHPNLTMSRPVQATSPPPSYTPRARPSFYPPHEATQRGDYDGSRQELRHPGYDAQYGGREPYSHQYEQPSRPGYNPQYEEPGRYDTHHEDHMRSGYGSRYDSQPRYGEPAGIPPYPPPETRNDHHRSRQSWLRKLIHRKPPRERMDIGL